MVYGQDDSGYTYDESRIKDRLRTQDMVSRFVTSSEFLNPKKDKKFDFDRRFWNSWKGRIVRAIVLDGVYTKTELLKITKLKEENFEIALQELFQSKLIEENQDTFRVPKNVYKQCWEFFKDLQNKLVSWVQDNHGSKMSHFFLSDIHLTNFTDELMKKAKHEIFVLNPYVEQCNINKTLMSMSESGVNVHLVARYIKPMKFKKKFLSKGILYMQDEAIHAKIILVDRRVGIVSSMNFFPKSVAGGSYEAGIASTDRDVIHSIQRYIHEII